MRIFSFLMILSFPVILIGHKKEAHEFWWQNNISNNMPAFNDWLGDVNANSRRLVRQHVQKKGYRSLLDVGCGLCTEFYGYQIDDIPIDYSGVDVTPDLVKCARENDLSVCEGTVEQLPNDDSSVDIVYARHLLEHLAYYDKALDELIRVASQEVIVVFFLQPFKNKTDYVCCEEVDGALLYHNWYNQNKLEKYILKHEKVAYIDWQPVNDQEVILHIYLQGE